MKKSDFYYDLPEELIAQTPIEPRNASRLMVLNKETGDICHTRFTELGAFLRPGDLLVLNNTRVLPARIFGRRTDTGSGPGKKAKAGHSFFFSDRLSAEVLSVLPDGNRILRFLFEGEFYAILNEVGSMPLPHYIHEELEDKERYQTVYSKDPGSAAAPTAGLHFTKEMLNHLQNTGINIAYVTLHVGLGTFRPVKCDNISEHKMHSEHYHIPEETARLINETKQNGGRVICVGTTSCRTLESAADESGYVKSQSGDTDIFITPGYRFKCLDALITNFHLPESTLIMLVSALAGHEHTMNAYRVAVEEKYRFFSFGDAMLIV